MRALLSLLIIGMAAALPCNGQFVNNTIASGLSFPPTNAGIRRSSAWGDLNNDGFQDVIAVSGIGFDIQLFVNDGLGNFTQQIAYPGSLVTAPTRGVSIADFDNDGDQDIYVCVAGNEPNMLLVNQGNATFINEAATRGVADLGDSYCAAFGDYNRDGWLDIYVGNRLVIVGTTGPYPLNTLYTSDGAGGFSDTTAASGTGSRGNCYAAVWFDYDDDGWPDIAIANDKGQQGAPPSALLRNMGNGTFQDVSVAMNAAAPIDGMGICTGDFDNDGDMDMFQTNDPPGHVVFEWDQVSGRYVLGQTWFSQALALGIIVVGSGWGCGFGDYDNDGFLDLFIVHQAGLNRLYHNSGGIGFQDATHSEGIPLCSPGDFSVMWVDVDNDGDLDIWDAGGMFPGQLGLNNSATGNHLTIDCAGTLSNRDAIGAKVKVTTATQTLRRTVQPFEGFHSGRDRRLHFGLGAATTALQIEIRWPSGTISYMENVAANQFLTITEPDYHVASGPMAPGSFNILNATVGATDSGLSYAAFLGVLPPLDVPIGNGRVIRVDPNDPLIPLSTTFGNPFFGGYAGIVGPSGFSTSISLPPVPTLAGLRFSTIGLTLQPTFPLGIKSVVGPRFLTIN